MVPLEDISTGGYMYEKGQAYTPPTENIATIMTRFLTLIFSLINSGIGNPKIMQSKTMSMIACAQTKALRLMHLPECKPSHEVQMYVTGRQLTVTMTVNVTTLIKFRPMKTVMILRNF